MKNSDYFNKATAEKLSIDLKLVKEITTYFWRYGVKRNLSEANYNAIFIKNFGTFFTSRYNLRKEITRTIELIRNIKNIGLTEEKLQEKLDQYYGNLKKLVIRRNEIAISYFKHKRKWDKPKI